MNRVLILVGVLLMLMAGTTQAYQEFRTGVRLDTMGGGDSFNGKFVTDTNDVYHWFGRIYSNADFAQITWDGDDAAGMGLVKSEETYGAYMIHFQEGFEGFMGEANNLTLGYGLPLSGFDVGVIFNRQSSSSTSGDTEMTESYNTFGAGATYDMDEETTLDFSFAFITGSADDGDDDSDDDPDFSGINFYARGFRAMRDDVTIVPTFCFMTGTEEIGSDEYKESMLGLGLAFDYVINDDNTLLVGGSWQQEKSEYPSGDDTIEETTTTLPGLFATVEHEFTEMFTLRVSGSKNFMKYDNGEDGDSLVEYTYYPWGYAIGLGIALGDWVIDLELYDEWLYDFGYWIHGEDGSTPIAQIEAKLFF